ncbi:MAG TPA: S41 family peptidase [Sphingomonas sp.]|nr:S41 family peptidase [Sphingomonas sp.]
MVRTWLSGFALLIATIAPAQDVPAVDTPAFIRAATAADVEAAWSALERNHPGAAPEMGDAHFVTILRTAHDLAQQRARQVTTYEGYLATMAGFSNALEDQHLSFKPVMQVARPNWVGLLLSLRHDKWIVTDEDPWPGRAPLKGAILTGCDGRSAEEVARERLGGFRAQWSIWAQRAMAAPWMLIDERNPFLHELKQCSFMTATGPRTIEMDWQPIARDAIAQRITKAAGIGAAGFDVRPVGKGWWIAMGELTRNAPAVVAAAKAHQAAIRTAPFVVFDLRGNGGGSSDLGTQIARVIYGDDVLREDAPADCPTAWRVSADNQALLESYPKILGDRLTPQANAEIQADIDAMRAAAAQGRAFSHPIGACRSTMTIKPPLHPRRVFLLTDRRCFSSCLIVVQGFRALGATQIGEPTNGNTRYQENHPLPLPSGLGAFAVQSTVDLAQPPRVGPFSPHIRYDGDLTDTDAVQRWLVSIADRHRP